MYHSIENKLHFGAFENRSGSQIIEDGSEGCHKGLQMVLLHKGRTTPVPHPAFTHYDFLPMPDWYLLHAGLQGLQDFGNGYFYIQ